MSRKKILMYNGGKASYYGCDSHKVLTKGNLYEVVAEKDICGVQTNYSLKGIEGEFNSVWFSEPISYFAYDSTVPVEGSRLRDFLRFDGVSVISVKHTSTIQYVEPIASDTYKVYTQNTLYILKILK